MANPRHMNAPIASEAPRPDFRSTLWLVLASDAPLILAILAWAEALPLPKTLVGPLLLAWVGLLAIWVMRLLPPRYELFATELCIRRGARGNRTIPLREVLSISPLPAGRVDLRGAFVAVGSERPRLIINAVLPRDQWIIISPGPEFTRKLLEACRMDSLSALPPGIGVQP